MDKLRSLFYIGFCYPAQGFFAVFFILCPDMVANHNVLNGFTALVPQNNRSCRKVEFIECDPIEITAVSRLAAAGKINSLAIHYILLPSKVNKLRLMKGNSTNYAKNILIKTKKYLTNRSVTAIIRKLSETANRIWGYSSAGSENRFTRTHI